MTAPVLVGPSPSGGGPAPSLTGRELDVLTKMAHGSTYVRLAREYGLAEPTMRGIGATLAKKLGAESITHAVFLACRAGILDGRPRSQRHGDHNGYTQHQKRREDACAACKAGERVYQAQRRAARTYRQIATS